MRKALFAALALVAGLAVYAAIGALGPADTRPNIVLVVVDALRKDHLGCYGYDRDTTPFIDSLAADGLLFGDAVSQSPWTTASMASMFTSRYPSELGVHAAEGPDKRRGLLTYSASALGPEPPTLAAMLHDSGYHTECVTANLFASQTFGITRGFDRFAEVRNSATRAVEYSLERAMEGAGGTRFTKKPFFLYIHLMDVHNPTDPPPPYDTMFPAVDGLPHEERHKDWEYKGGGPELDTPGFRAYKDHKTALYDGALRHVDDALARLARLLTERGIYGNTVVVVAADHGEEFWDHARFERLRFVEERRMLGRGFGVDHGHTMFTELLDVPLVMHGPNVPAGVVKRQVRNIDIAPTLLSIAGVAPHAGMHGIDLVAAYKHGDSEDLPAFSEDIAYGYEKKALDDGRYKYFRYFRGAQREFLFDTLADPAELTDISAREPEVAKRMRAELDGIVESSGDAESRAVKLDKRVMDELRSVGYLQ